MGEKKKFKYKQTYQLSIAIQNHLLKCQLAIDKFLIKIVNYFMALYVHI